MANPNPKPPPEHSRFKPGQSGNPGGRPVGPDVSRRLVKLLLTRVKDLKEAIADEDRLVADKVAEDWLKRLAGDGMDYRFFKEMLDRTEGRVADKQEITGEGGGPVRTELNLLQAYGDKAAEGDRDTSDE